MKRVTSDTGFSLLEMLVALSVVGAISGIAVMNLRSLSSSAENGAAQVLGFFKQARAKAISTTSAYFVVPSSNSEVITRVGTSCSDPAPVADPALALSLPSGASFSDTTWSVCFTSRGLSDSNFSVMVLDTQNGSKTVEVLLGGGVRYQGA